MIYGLTYIDYRTKSIFNGSDIGKPYSAKAILQKLAVEKENAPSLTHQSNTPKENPFLLEKVNEKNIDLDIPKVLEILFDPTEEKNYTPYELRQDKKKKKKPQPNHL